MWVQVLESVSLVEEPLCPCYGREWIAPQSQSPLSQSPLSQSPLSQSPLSQSPLKNSSLLKTGMVPIRTEQANICSQKRILMKVHTHVIN